MYLAKDLHPMNLETGPQIYIHLVWLQALGELCSSPSPSPSPFLHPPFLVFAETCGNEGSERRKKKEDICLEIQYKATISRAPYLHGNLHEFLWDTLISYFLTQIWKVNNILCYKAAPHVLSSTIYPGLFEFLVLIVVGIITIIEPTHIPIECSQLWDCTTSLLLAYSIYCSRWVEDICN